MNKRSDSPAFSGPTHRVVPIPSFPGMFWLFPDVGWLAGNFLLGYFPIRGSLDIARIACAHRLPLQMGGLLNLPGYPLLLRSVHSTTPTKYKYDDHIVGNCQAHNP